ncbi:MAG: peptidoglycan DD-metalloendopeptidase family protein [Eubacteriales bacterium]|nr:peptidoglycan DD-metalloendopeptidase family protein [Eubacteriales bacterium]
MKKILLFLMIVIVVATGIVSASAATLEDYQSQSKDISKDISKTQSQIENAEGKIDRLEEQQKQLETEEERQRRIYEEMLADLDSINTDIEDIGTELERSELEYLDQVEKLKQRLRIMYEYSTSSVLDILFESKNILDFFERLELMSSIAEENERLIEEVKVLKRDIDYKKYVKEMELTDLDALSKSQNGRIEGLLASRDQVSREIQNQNSYKKKLEKDLEDFKKDQAKVTQLIKEYQSKAKYAGGTMAWPLPSDYNVYSPFGMRPHPILKVNKMHTGVDIGGKHGASIVAANSGTVISAGWRGGYGYCVIIDHGSLNSRTITTLYAHCSKILVKSGAKVTKGQIIAKVGSTGQSTGPHLHFEVRENGEPVNPINGNYLIKK